MSVETIRGVLTNPQARYISFQLPGIPAPIRGWKHFPKVARWLVAPADRRSDAVVVDVSSSLGNVAMYQHQINTLWVNSQSFPRTAQEQALIIHEAVHIHNDRKRFAMPWDDDEMLAYVAQFIYLKLRDTYTAVANRIAFTRMERAGIDIDAEAERQMTGCPTRIGTASDLSIERWASAVADSVLRRQTPSNRDLLNLRSAIRRHPAYAGLPIDYATGEAATRHYSGIGPARGRPGTGGRCRVR